MCLRRIVRRWRRRGRRVDRRSTQPTLRRQPKSLHNFALRSRVVCFSSIFSNLSSLRLYLDVDENTQLVTPTTTRYHDVLAKTTPRHRIQVAARLPLTPRTPRTPNHTPTLYNAARQLFVRSAAPSQLIGRASERTEVQAFLDEGIASKSGRCLYISGPPGTGKSAFVGEVCGTLADRQGIQTAYVNCMSIRNVKEICAKLTQELHVEPSESQESLDGLKNLFFPKRKSAASVYVVTLDEIDHLLTFDLEMLYTLFEWALNPTSRLVLIGIANALDLTDRFLPRLKARNLQPRLLQFTPYTVPEIVSVITTRLQSLSYDPAFTPFVHPAAIQFCAKKVASQTGDLRKAFDLIRRVIDVVEAETKAAQASSLASSPLSENPNLSTPSKTPRSPSKQPTDPLSHLTPQTAPRATVAHAARIAAAAFNNGTSQRLKTLNVQQKAALCALVSLEKKNTKTAKEVSTPFRTPTKPAPPTVRALHGLYGQLCRREGTLAPLERGEFGEVVASLETLGLVRDAPVKTAKIKALGGVMKDDRGIVSAVSEKELEGALEGAVGGLLKGLLNGDE
jgi:cell division control protein 6